MNKKSALKPKHAKRRYIIPSGFNRDEPVYCEHHRTKFKNLDSFRTHWNRHHPGDECHLNVGISHSDDEKDWKVPDESVRDDATDDGDSDEIITMANIAVTTLAKGARIIASSHESTDATLNDTVLKDTVPKDTVPKDTVLKDTVPKDTTPKDTSHKNMKSLKNMAVTPKDMTPKVILTPKDTTSKATTPKDTTPKAKDTTPKNTTSKVTTSKARL